MQYKRKINLLKKKEREKTRMFLGCYADPLSRITRCIRWTDLPEKLQLRAMANE